MLLDGTSQPLRIVTIGDESVGKTSITSRLVDNTFNQCEPETVGANYQTYTVCADGQYTVLQIWDTAGQEKYKSLSPIYFRNALAAVVVFSLVSRRSFDKLEDWSTSFREVAGPSALVYVVANKTDLTDQYEVSIDQGKEWAEEHGYKFFATSAKTGENIKELFTDIAVNLQQVQNSTQVQHTDALKTKDKNKGCC